MDIKELQKKSDNDLITFVNEKREELRKLRFGLSGSGTRNTKAVRNVKQEIARALTEIGARSRKNG